MAIVDPRKKKMSQKAADLQKKKKKQPDPPAIEPMQKQIRKVAKRMERQNYLESRPLSDAKVHSVIKHNLSVAHPEKTGEELDEMVNQILKTVMQPYKGPAATKPPPKPILGRDLYDAERRQTVKNMRSVRRRG